MYDELFSKGKYFRYLIYFRNNCYWNFCSILKTLILSAFSTTVLIDTLWLLYTPLYICTCAESTDISVTAWLPVSHLNSPFPKTGTCPIHCCYDTTDSAADYNTELSLDMIWMDLFMTWLISVVTNFQMFMQLYEIKIENFLYSSYTKTSSSKWPTSRLAIWQQLLYNKYLYNKYIYSSQNCLCIFTLMQQTMMLILSIADEAYLWSKEIEDSAEVLWPQESPHRGTKTVLASMAGAVHWRRFHLVKYGC